MPIPPFETPVETVSVPAAGSNDPTVVSNVTTTIWNDSWEGTTVSNGSISIVLQNMRGTYTYVLPPS
jgi:hypothetical protein